MKSDNFLVWDVDDFGCNRVISDVCQSHDCRDQLDKFHYANPNFKATLFAIPAEMTPEIAKWCKSNSSWIELAVHGIFHSSNYECEKMSYDEFDGFIKGLQPMLDTYFVKGFKAPGWQISDDIYRWLVDNGWWIADQSYNDPRRPDGLLAYVNNNNEFYANRKRVDASHHHTWDCCGNGVYEQEEHILGMIKGYDEFKFISEVLR